MPDLAGKHNSKDEGVWNIPFDAGGSRADDGEGGMVAGAAWARRSLAGAAAMAVIYGRAPSRGSSVRKVTEGSVSCATKRGTG